MNRLRAQLPRLLKGLLIFLALFWAQSGIHTVQPNEQGVLLRFGRVVRALPPGMHFSLPWPADKVVRVPTTEVRRLSVGAVWAGLPSYRDQWLTGDTNIVELTGNVQYTISDPVDYLFSLHGSLDSGELLQGTELLKSAESEGAGALAAAELGRDLLVLQVTEAVLAELMAAMTVDDVLAAGKTELQLRGVREVQALLDELHAGIHISAINLAEITAPSAVIQAFTDVSSARADREREIDEAHRDAKTRLPYERTLARELVEAANKYSNEVLARAKGESESFVKLAAEKAKAPDIVQRRRWLQGLRTALGKVETKIVQPGATVYVRD